MIFDVLHADQLISFVIYLISLVTYFSSNISIASLNWFEALLNLQLFQILLLTFLRDRKRLSVLGLGHK